MKWETSKEYTWMARCKVKNGWLVESEYENEYADTGSITFIYDPKHEWDWNEDYDKQGEEK